jgi:hypothetical protein
MIYIGTLRSLEGCDVFDSRLPTAVLELDEFVIGGYASFGGVSDGSSNPPDLSKSSNEQSARVDDATVYPRYIILIPQKRCIKPEYIEKTVSIKGKLFKFKVENIPRCYLEVEDIAPIDKLLQETACKHMQMTVKGRILSIGKLNMIPNIGNSGIKISYFISSTYPIFTISSMLI